MRFFITYVFIIILTFCKDTPSSQENNKEEKLHKKIGIVKAWTYYPKETLTSATERNAISDYFGCEVERKIVKMLFGITNSNIDCSSLFSLSVIENAPVKDFFKDLLNDIALDELKEDEVDSDETRETLAKIEQQKTPQSPDIALIGILSVVSEPIKERAISDPSINFFINSVLSNAFDTDNFNSSQIHKMLSSINDKLDENISKTQQNYNLITVVNSNINDTTIKDSIIKINAMKKEIYFQYKNNNSAGYNLAKSYSENPIFFETIDKIFILGRDKINEIKKYS